MAENFDFETAIEFLPVMNGNDNITIQLIKNIDFYSSLLNEKSNKFLINFVLKTRLTEVGKFYLKQTYNDIGSLLSDMVHYLLPKKLHFQLQNSLNSFKQANNESHIDHPLTILANQYEVSNSECIPQDQQSSQRDLSECTDLNNYNNSVMKSDSDSSPVCHNSRSDNNCVNKIINVSNEDKLKIVKESFKSKDDLIELSKETKTCKEPRIENFNELEKKSKDMRIVKRSNDIVLILGNNIEDSVKGKKIVKSKEGFCSFVPSEKKLYLNLKFLEIGKIFMGDLEIFCRNRNIKELKMNKNKNSRKDIKKFIRLIRKYNVGYPRIRINNKFIDIVKVNEVKSKYSETNDIMKNKSNDINKMSTINNMSKKVSKDKGSHDRDLNGNDNSNGNIVMNCKVENKERYIAYTVEEKEIKSFVRLCVTYDERTVGIT